MSTLHFNILLLVDDFVNLHGWSAVQKKSLCEVVKDRNIFLGLIPILNQEILNFRPDTGTNWYQQIQVIELPFVKICYLIWSLILQDPPSQPKHIQL